MSLDIFKCNCIKVTPSTLFKKAEYQGLSDEERWQKALNDGWRFDPGSNKFYKLT
jgi:hypothetical protein